MIGHPEAETRAEKKANQQYDRGICIPRTFPLLVTNRFRCWIGTVPGGYSYERR